MYGGVGLHFVKINFSNKSNYVGHQLCILLPPRFHPVNTMSWQRWKLTIRQSQQIPPCTCPMSNNIPFRTEMCALLFWMVHDMGQAYCGIYELGLLTHWGRVTQIFVSKLNIIGSDNGLSPGRRQAIIWTNAGILLIGALGTNVSEILIKICTFSLKKMLLKCRLEKGGHLVSASMC